MDFFGSKFLRSILSLSVILLIFSEASGQSYDTFQLNSGKGLPVITAPMTPNQAKGQAMWYMSAANHEYHSTSFHHRLGGAMNFWKMLRSDRKYTGQTGGKHLGRWELYGSINDPDCCAPGKDCEDKVAKSKDPRWKAVDLSKVTSESTFGMDYCLGDEKLMAMYDSEAGKWKLDPNWDPACKPPFNNCALGFGAPSGVIGFRKFPNPRFEAKKWKQINGRLGTWQGWENLVLNEEGVMDEAIQAPFRVGMACASCHVTHNPINPGSDPERPTWANIRGAFGSQHARSSEIHTSGLPVNNIQRLLFSSRPGIVDTSAAPHDYVFNPSTMLAIVNLDKKPTFPAVIRGKQRNIHRILKGGEDSSGIFEAIQRVYINIGVCAEQCWLNKLTDITVMSPSARNYGQLPFDPKQCAKDCKSFAALTVDTNDYAEEHGYPQNVAYIGEYLVSRRPVDLELALEPQMKSKGYKINKSGLKKYIEKDLQVSYGGKDYSFEKGDIEKGAAVFAKTCAKCHSTQHLTSGGDPKSFAFKTNASAYWATDANGVRKDFLGNDELTPFTEVGTNRCRTLHSNHLKGHVYEYYSSDTYKSESNRPNLSAHNEGKDSGGGRGYLRNLSLLSLWATAPYLHNNSVGPEICGAPDHPENLYRFAYRWGENSQLFYMGDGVSPRVVSEYTTISPEVKCVKPETQINGRIGLALASMDKLLNPSERLQKVGQLTEPVKIPVAFHWEKSDNDAFLGIYKMILGLLPKGMEGSEKIAELIAGALSSKPVKLHMEVPIRTPIASIGNLEYKKMIADMIAKKGGQDVAAPAQVMAVVEKIVTQATSNPGEPIKIEGSELKKLMAHYNTCNDLVENKGHEFGAQLDSDPVKNKELQRALMAFLLTL